MKKVFFVLVAFFMLNLQSFATTWVQVGDYEFIDKDSINYYTNDRGEVLYGTKVYWMKTLYHDGEYFKQAQTGIEKKIAYILSQRIIDVNKKAVTTKAIIYFDEQGNTIISYSPEDFELKWSAIVPNSRGELWYELVRKPRYLKKMYKYQHEQQNQ